jgi:hypothetical protein
MSGIGPGKERYRETTRESRETNGERVVQGPRPGYIII